MLPKRMKHPIQSILNLILLASLVLLFSCNEESILNNTVVLSEGDSLVIDKIDTAIYKGKFEKVSELIDSATKSLEYANHKLFRLKVLERSAILHYKSGKLELAFDDLNRIILESENEQKYIDACVFATQFKGYLFYGLGDYRSANKHFYKALELNKNTGKSCESATIYHRLSLSLYRQQNYSESVIFLKLAFLNYRECEKKDFWSEFKLQEILSNIGLCYYKLNSYDSSIYYYDSALAYIQQTYKLKDAFSESLEVAEGVIYGNKGKSYMAMKNYEMAIPLLYKNIEINSKDKYDKLDAVTSRIALARYYFAIKKYKEFNKILEIPKEYYNFQPYYKQLIYVFDLKSTYFELIKDYKNALEYKKRYHNAKTFLSTQTKKINDADVQLSLEILKRENQYHRLSKENQQRKFYINITIYVSLGLILLTVVISIFLRISNRKNIELKISNDKIKTQQHLLKIANSEITQNNEELKQRDIEKNRILSIVAHDLRNPNNAIYSIVKTLQDDDNLNEEQREYLELMEISANSNKDLIQEILHFAKPGQFDVTEQFKILNIADFLQTCVSLNKPKATEKGIELVLQDIDTTLSINVNEEKMRRAISNIIVNAIKFSHKQSKIIIRTSNTEVDVFIHIRDFGIGIPDRLKDSIFKSDPKIRRVGTDGEASFGLGLSIVKQIIEDHYGNISFESDDSGTEFTIRLAISNK